MAENATVTSSLLAALRRLRALRPVGLLRRWRPSLAGAGAFIGSIAGLCFGVLFTSSSGTGSRSAGARASAPQRRRALTRRAVATRRWAALVAAMPLLGLAWAGEPSGLPSQTVASFVAPDPSEPGSIWGVVRNGEGGRNRVTVSRIAPPLPASGPG